jgi:outer membrane protein insertion porin family/translocation and assembly module TamA
MTWSAAVRAATIALFATVVSVAAPASAQAQSLSCDPGDLEVRALDFRGNRAIGDGDLAVRVTTTPSSWGRRKLHLWFAEKRCLNRNELPRDVLRLQAYYRERGFYSAQVDTLVQPLGKDAVRVVFNIKEGEPTRLASDTVKGLNGIKDSADIVQHLQLRVGQPFDLGLFRADIDTIVHRLRDAGYYRAEVLHSYEIKTDSLLARATLTVLPGKPAKFGEPVLKITPLKEQRGQQIANPVVRRVLRISRGDPYSERAIVDAQRNLFQLGAYRHIEVAPLPDSLQPPGDTIVLLEVRLTEDYMHQMDSEVGWATLDCVRVRLQYTDKNWLGTARRLELNGQASKIGYGNPVETEATQRLCTLGKTTELKDDRFSLDMHYFVGATVRQPRLLGTRWVPTVSLYSERRGEFKAYLRSTEIGADVSATRDLSDRTPFRLAYTFEYGRTEADAPALCALFNRCDLASQEQTSRLLPLGVASAGLARIRTDNMINPSRGFSLRGEIRSSASRLLGSSDELFFNKGTGDIAWYYPLGYRNVLAFRVRGGAVLGRRLSLSDASGFVPPQERLYAGGPTSVRGFQQNELGAAVYIARIDQPLRTDTIPTPSGNVFHFEAKPDSIRGLDRTVPLGGNSLFVANMEYRIRDPFLFPDLLQYALFLDGGDVWTRGPISHWIKWTPGIGFRALTPVGPVQINVGYNRYKRDAGALYYNPNVTTLLCVTPGNKINYQPNPDTGVLEQVDKGAKCDNFDPPPRTRWTQRLTFTFSIGSDF